MRPHRLLGVLLLAALAGPLGRPAAAAERPAARPVARLAAPAPGAVWTAGSPAAVEWEPGPGLAALSHVEEWEAFLSLDGGRTYPVRITPHLDRSLRRFVFEVPRFPTRQARLLLRFGDERREVEAEMPGLFTIEDGPVSATLPPLPAFRRGEAARDREPGVVAWIEGGRDGQDSWPVETARLPVSCRGAFQSPPFPLFLAGPAAGHASLPPPAPGQGEDPFRRLRAARSPGDPAPPPSRAAVRLLIHRFNE